jgi:hypothetical protein
MARYFVVSKVTFEGSVFRFRARIPSNGHEVDHTFRLNGDGTMDDRFTAHHTSGKSSDHEDTLQPLG